LARALRQSPRGGKNYAVFAESRKLLKEIVGGVLEYDEASARWQFATGRHRFLIGVTAEGIKKIAILDTLLGNRYLEKGSIVLIDEPESALHPTAISRLLDIVAILAEWGLQFFLASHSYFILKKLLLISQARNMSIPVISATDSGWLTDDLKSGMPDNPIVAESIRLYKEEIKVALR
jgi:hypothetical protein